LPSGPLAAYEFDMGQKAHKLEGEWRSWLSQVLIVLLLLRAVVPAGYMPDLGAVAQGQVGIVICSANGSYTIDHDGQSQNSTPASRHKLTETCAFSGLAQAYMANAVAPEVLPTTIYAPVPFTIASQTVLPPVRAGPAHGSRAPPSIS